MVDDMNKPKTGDIYRWRWNDKTLKELDYKNQAGTLYHCCSKICVYKDNEHFWDTYWGGNNYQYDKRFSILDASEKLDMEYLGNFDDLKEGSKSDRAYYEDKDCVDISHANSTRGGFYIRKGAKKSLEKMRKVVKRNLRKLEGEERQAKLNADWERAALNDLSEDSHISLYERVSLRDDSYEDE